MILLDTHIWIWWETDPDRLTQTQLAVLNKPSEEFAVSIISCWEIAKLVAHGRLGLDIPVAEWLESALLRPELTLLPLTPQIAVESTQLPGSFHRDPADQLIVATARLNEIPILTADSKILEYPHVRLAV